jgi:hypothetical protein
MVSVQFEGKNQEKDEVMAYVFTIMAIPSPMAISPRLADKLQENLNNLFPDPDSPFASEIEIDQVNEKRQSIFIEVRIKNSGESLDEISLSNQIKNTVEQLINA